MITLIISPKQKQYYPNNYLMQFISTAKEYKLIFLQAETRITYNKKQ